MKLRSLTELRNIKKNVLSVVFYIRKKAINSLLYTFRNLNQQVDKDIFQKKKKILKTF